MPRRRVLLIEDHRLSALGLEIGLRLLGHDPMVVHDGPAGLAIAHTFRPEVVLCDIGLRGMDGYQVARAFRADVVLRDIFLVALSGYTEPEDVQHASDAGFDRHIAKPADMETLARVIADVTGDSPRPA